METQTTQNETKQNNALVYILLVVIIILLGYIGYLYGFKDMVKKDDLKDKYILKSDIAFSMLPSYEKSRYINFYEHDTQINELQQQIRNLKNTQPTVVEVEKVIEKIVNVPVEKVVEVEKIVEIQNSIPYNNDKTTFNTFTCKNLEEGSISVSKSCQSKLYKFLDENRGSKSFEVIGMVDDKDFKFINKLKDVYGENKIKNLAKYSQIGLSRQRVIEASWLIKKHIGNYDQIKAVNYTLNSKNNKGFVVRAYK
ncbi:MAG: hypothetical protein WA945_09125 [Arcobacteraceae bacterium]